MKTINGHLYLPVPIGAHTVSILTYPKNHELWYCVGEDSEAIGLPSKDLELLCLASEVTEEILEENNIVEFGVFSSVKKFFNYKEPFSSNPEEAFCDTRLESFHSLLEANEMYLTNPIPKPNEENFRISNNPMTEASDFIDWELYKIDLKTWQSYQDKLSDYAILKQK